MVKQKKEPKVEIPKVKNTKPITGACTFSQECPDKTEENNCTWNFGCGYRKN